MARSVALARWWWTFIVRGTLAILFGVLAFFAPGLGAAVLVGLFAAWVIIDGIGNILAGVRGRGRDRNWWLELLEGVVGIAAGLIALLFPVYAAGLLVLLIAIWAIVTGVLEIIAAIRLRELISGEVWMGLGGVASILFGVILITFPAAGALSLVWLISSSAIVFGVFLILLGWRLRGINELAQRHAG